MIVRIKGVIEQMLMKVNLVDHSVSKPRMSIIQVAYFPDPVLSNASFDYGCGWRQNLAKDPNQGNCAIYRFF